VLSKEKEEEEKKKLEEIERKKLELAQKPKEIPKNHYIPSLVVFRSTKSLTNFQEFNFKNSSRKSSTSK